MERLMQHLLVVVIVLVINIQPPSSEQRPLTCSNFPTLCEAISDTRLQHVANEVDSLDWPYHVGRFKQPTPIINVDFDVHAGHLWRFFTLKRWHYQSLTTDKYFLAFALVQFNYIADVFVYLVEKKTKEKFEFHTQRVFGIGIKFAQNLTDCSMFYDLSYQNVLISSCYNQETTKWDLQMNGIIAYDDLNKTSITMDVAYSVSLTEGLSLVFPVHGELERPLYVYKNAGLDAHGSLTVNGALVDDFQRGAVGIDWTKGHAKYHTQWRWSSMSSSTAKVTNVITGQVTNQSFGINFSNLVYDVLQTLHGNEYQTSAENVVWVDHRAFSLRYPVNISLPVGDDTSWTVKSLISSKEEQINLRFTPWGQREDHLNVGLLRSDFVQPFGVYNGFVLVTSDDSSEVLNVTVDAFIGVVENHDALW